MLVLLLTQFKILVFLEVVMENESYRSVIENMTDAINESGLKQKAVAERFGISARQLNDILHYRKRMDVGLVPVFCNALGLPLNRLFNMRAAGVVGPYGGG